MSLVGIEFPNISIKAIDELGDTFNLNVLEKAKRRKESIVILVPKGFYLCVSN